MNSSEAEIRVLAPAGIEDYHAHLLRLDSDSRGHLTGSADDRAVESHSLRLLARQAILIGAYVDGVLRAGIEIIPDRAARLGDANFTIEKSFRSPALGRALIARAIKEARTYRLLDLKLHGLDDEQEMVQQATAEVLGKRSAFALSASYA